MTITIRHAEPHDYTACALIYAQPQAAGGTMQIPLQAAVDLADNWLNLLRLELTVYTDNTVAQRLYRKHGFVLEGTHRAYALRQGRYADVHAMARLHPAPPAI